MDLNIDNYLRVNLTDMLLVLISTFLIVVLVRMFFWKYVRQYLAGREAFVQSQLDASQENLKESEALKEKYEVQMRGAKDDANSLMKNAKVMADAEAHDIIASAREDAKTIKDKAYQDMEEEKMKMVKELKKESSDVAFEVAKRLLAKEVDEDVQKRYVKEFMNKVEKE